MTKTKLSFPLKLTNMMYVEDGIQMIREWYIKKIDLKEVQGMREYVNTTGQYLQERESLCWQPEGDKKPQSQRELNSNFVSEL